MNEGSKSSQARPESGRRPWVSPELRTMRAGSAEAGPNPVAPEGAFAKGS